MTLTLAAAESKLHAEYVWTLKAKNARGIYLPVMRKKNLVTNYGLTALASAIGGGYINPGYLVIDTFYSTLNSGLTAGVSTTVVTPARVDIVGDTQIVLDPGQVAQEAVTFSSVTGSGPYTYNLTTPPTNTHTSGAKVVRQVTLADGMSSVLSEGQFDSTNYPGLRAPNAGGYSTGNGNFTMAFYFTSTQANLWLMTLGLADNQTIGAGNLHNHIIFAYNNTAGSSDFEVDVSLTLS